MVLLLDIIKNERNNNWLVYIVILKKMWFIWILINWTIINIFLDLFKLNFI